MEHRWVVVTGIVVEGHRVASGSSKDYPYSSLERQKPIFKERGLDLGDFFQGTLNISIAPRRFRMVRPAYTFRQVAWTDLHPPEDFSFSACKVRFRGNEYDGYVYYPHPETKIRHFQDPTLIEVIAKWIPDIDYENQVELVLDSAEIGIAE